MISLRARLSVSYMWIILISITAVGILANLCLERQFRSYILKNIENRNRQLVALISKQYSQNRWSETKVSDIGINAMEEGLFIRVMDADGRMVWDAFTHNNGFCREMIAHMANNMASRYPNWQGSYMESDYVVKRGETIVGKVLIGYYGPFYYKDTDLAFINTLNRILAGVLLIALVIALVTGTVTSRRISNPITRVIETAREIAAGNLKARSQERTDIKEINQLVRSINELAEALENQEKIRKRLTADVAHELRTPLSTLQSHLEAMIDGIWEIDEGRLKGCHAEILRLIRMVKDLERLTKYDSDWVALSKSEFDLSQLAEQIVANLRPEFENKSVALAFSRQPAVLSADRDKISQVIINLLVNSLKFTPEGGSVEVDVKASDERVELQVRDNGIGIKPEDLPYIFERFYRGDKSRNRMSGGSGIGLTITKAIVDAHGGRIDVQSQFGQGSCFTVVLPKGIA